MLNYTIKYKQPKHWFWRTIKDVVEDGTSLPDESSVPYRFFLKQDKTLIIIPAQGTLFKFSAERAESIKKNEALKKEKEEENEQK